MHQVDGSGDSFMANAIQGVLHSTAGPHSWYYDKDDLKDSPSLHDGLDWDCENRYRREGARFVINVGTKMGLRYDTMATGVVFFHRFYMFHSFKTFPRYVTACCCLFLAGKVEETPKKCKDIIRIARTFLTDAQFAEFGDDPKEEVMTLERILLQTIRFDFQVDHPYAHLLKFAKCLKGDKLKLQKMVQMAWTFINDSLCTTLCLQWEPEIIAVALMHLAGKLSKFDVVDWTGRLSKHKHWWDVYISGLSVPLLEDICHQVLDLYSAPVAQNPQVSPPATPPTKSTWKPSQGVPAPQTPPSPSESKGTPVGMPIPRLEPGELKHKTSKIANRNEFDETPDFVSSSESKRNLPAASSMMYSTPVSNCNSSDVEKVSSCKQSAPASVYNPSNQTCCSCGTVYLSSGSADSGKLSSSTNSAPVSMYSPSRSTCCSCGAVNRNSSSGNVVKPSSSSGDTVNISSNLSDALKINSSPETYAIESLPDSTAEAGFLMEGVDSKYGSPLSTTDEYTSQIASATYDTVPDQPIVSTTAAPITGFSPPSLDISVKYSTYIQPSVSFEGQYYAAQPHLQPPQQPATFLRPQLRMSHTAPSPQPPSVLIPPPQLTIPPPLQFPEMYAPLPPPPQYQPANLPPPQAVPATQPPTPQYPPPPPLHPQGPNTLSNNLPQSSSNITRPPPPLVRAPVPPAARSVRQGSSLPGMSRAPGPHHPQHPLKCPSLSQDAPHQPEHPLQRPSLSQNAPRPPEHPLQRPSLSQNAPFPPEHPLQHLSLSQNALHPPEHPLQHPSLSQNAPRPPEHPLQCPSLSQNAPCPPEHPLRHPSLSQNSPHPPEHPLRHPSLSQNSPHPPEHPLQRPSLSQSAPCPPEHPLQHPSLSQNSPHPPEHPLRHPSLSQNAPRPPEHPPRHPSLSQNAPRPPEHPPRHPSLSQNAPHPPEHPPRRPSLSQNSPHPPPPSQHAHCPVSQNSSHRGSQNAAHPANQNPGRPSLQNTPPPPMSSMHDVTSHYGYLQDSNLLHPLHEVRSSAPESVPPPSAPHMRTNLGPDVRHPLPFHTKDWEHPLPFHMEDREHHLPFHMEDGEHPLPFHMKDGEHPLPFHMEDGEHPLPFHMKDGEHPLPFHMKDGEHPLTFHMKDREHPQELGRGGPRLAYDSRYQHFQQETDMDSHHSYTDASRDHKYSGYGRNFGPRRRPPNRYGGHYEGKMPHHPRQCPPPFRQHHFQRQSGSRRPSYLEFLVPNEEPSGPGRSGRARKRRKPIMKR